MSDEIIKLNRDLENIFSTKDPIRELLFSSVTEFYSSLRSDEAQWDLTPHQVRLDLESLNEYIVVDRPAQINELIEAELGLLNGVHGADGMDSMIWAISNQDNESLRKIVALPIRLLVAETFSSQQ
jgi:hypothetical protein